MNPLSAATSSGRGERRVRRTAAGPLLPDCVEARLIADGRVLAFGVDPVMETFERCVGLGGAGLVVRRVKLESGLATLIVAPGDVFRDKMRRKGLFLMKRLGTGAHRRVVLASEMTVRRQPDLDNAMTIAAAANAAVSPTDRIRVLTFLVDQGGSGTLEDCAGCMRTSPDPVASILALAARKIVTVDIREPIGPNTSVRAMLARRR